MMQSYLIFLLNFFYFIFEFLQSKLLNKVQSVVEVHIMKHQQPIYLPYFIPELSKAVGFSAGMRPYRQGGIRMQKTILQGKKVYHDYGHGGGGLSLGYGCAKHVVEQLFLPQNVSKNQPIAVIGAGIVGLNTAFILIELGYSVNVYADIIPFQQSKQKPEITTTVAAAYWMPLKVGNKQQTDVQAIDTWNHYMKIRDLQQKTGRNLGITLLRAYCVNDDEGFTNYPIKGIIQPKDCIVTFGDNIFYKAKTFHTLVIEVKFYIPYIMDIMQKSGRFNLVREKISSTQDIIKKKEQHIFNCTGLGSKSVFQDPNANRGIKGHLVKFKLSDYKSVKDFILFMKTIEGRWILQVPQQQSGVLALGISYEENKKDSFIEMSQIAKTIQTTRNFFLQVEANHISPRL